MAKNPTTKNEDEAAATGAVALQDFFFPTLDRTIRADSMEEAQKIAARETAEKAEAITA